MLWKVLTGASLLAILVIMGVWFAHGQNNLSKDKVPMVVKKVNPIFGTEEESIEWKDEFRLGLDYALPASGAALVLGGVSFLMMRRQKRV